MKKIYNLLILVTIPLSLILISYTNGSPGGFSGSLGDGGSTCTSCHSGTAQPQNNWITSDIPPEGFTPGETYTIVATGMHTGVVKFGFEITAEDSFGSKLGTFTITDATRTKLVAGNSAVTQTSSGTTPSGSMCSWSVNWTAPDPAPATIKFNASFCAGNGSGTSGDATYTSVLNVQKYIPYPQIVEIDPDIAMQGFEGTISITGENTNWLSGVDEVLFVYHQDNTVMFEGTDMVIYNDELLEVNVQIPYSIEVGSYDVYVGNVILMNGFTVDQLESITEEGSVKLKVYPNPADQIVFIDCPEGATITVINLSGKIIENLYKSNEEMAIDISKYLPGYYLISVNYNKEVFYKRLIVK